MKRTIQRKEYERQWHKAHRRKCIDCGRMISAYATRCPSCNIKQMHKKGYLRKVIGCGKNHPSWKGGRRIDERGYVMIWVAQDDFFYPMVGKRNCVSEHRLENLKLTTKGSHILEHNKGYKDGYRQGYQDGQSLIIRELKQQIKLLQWQIKELTNSQKEEGQAYYTLPSDSDYT